MGELLLLMLSFAAGLVVGWVLLPEPQWFRDFWAKWGWARPST